MLTLVKNMTDKKLARSITDTHLSLTRLKAEFIVTLAEFHDRDLAPQHGATSTADWAARTQDIARRTAVEYIQVGTRLRPFTLLATAFLEGRITYSKLRLLLRYMTSDNEDELLELALAHPLTELETLLAGRDRIDGGKQKAKNRLSVTVDPETGGVRFWGSLDPERGAELLAALKIAELSQNGEETEDGADTQSATTRFGPPTATGLTSAFVAMCHIVRSSPQSRVTAPGAQVNILMTLDNRAYIPDHHGGQTGEVLRTALNGEMRVHLLDSRGLHLKLSRRARVVTPAQEKALLARWGWRCASPGCGHTRWLQFHHIRAWAEGGETNLDNLIPLCSAHHIMLGNDEMVIVSDAVDPSLLRFRFAGGESYTSADRQPAMFNAALGRWADSYDHGPVPDGDEDLLQIWEAQDSFADVPAGQG